MEPGVLVEKQQHKKASPSCETWQIVPRNPNLIPAKVDQHRLYAGMHNGVVAWLKHKKVPSWLTPSSLLSLIKTGLQVHSRTVLTGRFFTEEKVNFWKMEPLRHCKVPLTEMRTNSLLIYDSNKTFSVISHNLGFWALYFNERQFCKGKSMKDVWKITTLQAFNSIWKFDFMILCPDFIWVDCYKINELSFLSICFIFIHLVRQRVSFKRFRQPLFLNLFKV